MKSACCNALVWVFVIGVPLCAQPLDSFFGEMIALEGGGSDLAIQPDGKIIIAGNFQRLGQSASRHLVRLNTNGTIDESFAIGSGPDQSVLDIEVQPDGRILVAGSFTSFNGQSAKKLVRLNSDGSIDNTFDLGAGFSGPFGGAVYGTDVQSDGKIIVYGEFTAFNGVPKMDIIRLSANGVLDMSFDAGAGAEGGVITEAKLRPDGSIIVMGGFTTFGGTPRSQLCLLDANGVLNGGFTPQAGAGSVLTAMAVQTDGKVLVGGFFTTFNGSAHKNLVRLNADGTTDSGFSTGSGTDGPVYSLDVGTDGRILATGPFLNYNGVSGLSGYVLINANGSPDTGFQVGNVPQTTYGLESSGKYVLVGKRVSQVLSTGMPDATFQSQEFNTPGGAMSWAAQSDGRLLAGGKFTSYRGETANYLVRINRDGTRDMTFNSGGTGPNGLVSSLVVQPDDKIVIGGLFTAYNGITKFRIMRLNKDGTPDNSFEGPSADFGNLNVLVLQPDGKILVGGFFVGNYGAQPVKHLFRINSNGTYDNTFDIGTGPNSQVNHLRLLPDGKIIVAGTFSAWGGQPARVVRLEASGAQDNSFVSNLPSVEQVASLAVDEQQRVYVGLYVSGVNSPRLVRCLSSGTVDNTFVPMITGSVNSVLSILPLSSGKILVGMAHYPFEGNVSIYLHRLLSDGAADLDFMLVSPDHEVSQLFEDIDGRIVFSGSFRTADGQPRLGLAAIATLPPSPPAVFSVSSTTTHGATLTWTDNLSTEVGFELERGLSGSSYSSIGSVGRNSTTFVDGGLVPDVTYFYRVRSFNSAGQSAYAEANGTTMAFPAPSNLMAVYEPHKVILSWTDNTANENAFVIERSIVGGTGYSQLATVPANSTTYNDEPLTVVGEHTYRVRARNAEGFSAYSNEAVEDVIAGTPLPPDGFSLYTTNTGELVVEWEAQEVFLVKLHDLQGRVLHNLMTDTGRVTMPLNRYPQGIFIVNVQAPRVRWAQRVGKAAD